MTPGPTRIPARVLEAGSQVLHHRTPEFSGALAETIRRLRPYFGATAADVLPIHATGRAGMEGAIVNLLAPGDTVVACCNGKFGEMWAGFAEAYGLTVERVAADWERSVDPGEVEAAVERANPAAVLVVHSDTSTGVLNPVSEIAAAARARDALIFVDGISSVAGVPFAFDAWGVDFAVTSSQKCLMSSPGLSFVVVSDRAWARAPRSGFPRAYLDFEAVRRTLGRARPETPGTTPVSLVLQVLEALRILDEEGRDAVFNRHAEMARRLRERAREMGFGLQGRGIVKRSFTLTALTVPPGVDPVRLREAVRQEDILIAVGLGRYAPTSVRVGHMGDIRTADVEATMDAIAGALARAAV
jgi:aspartate aminotransferase-like enzyme